MSKPTVKNLFTGIWESIVEQKIIFAVSPLTFVVSCVLIFYEGKSSIEQLFQWSLLALLISLPISRITAQLSRVKKYIFQILGVLAAGV